MKIHHLQKTIFNYQISKKLHNLKYKNNKTNNLTNLLVNLSKTQKYKNNKISNLIDYLTTF